MPPINENPNGAKKTAQRRKSKPKFELPAEVAAAQPPAWVYRHTGAAAKPSLAPMLPPRAPSVAAPPPRPAFTGPPDPTTIMLAAIETMAHTVAAANRMFLAAASLMGAPIEVTRKILGL